jgi:hypothetical protein
MAGFIRVINAFLTCFLSVFNAFLTGSMVPFKTKLKPVLMNKKRVFNTSFSFFISFSYTLHSAADFKKIRKTRFFSAYVPEDPVFGTPDKLCKQFIF